jgi:uncharacterized protein (DUF2236 family)
VRAEAGASETRQRRHPQPTFKNVSGSIRDTACVLPGTHPVVEGYFPEDSAIRRIGGESVLMLGGGRALLMQVAHPVVARGVARHSSYATDPWRRLARTMTALYTIVLGTREEADRAAAITQAVHARVPGADDPDAQLWVHATLVDTGLVMYERFVRRLAEAERAAFYDEMCLVAELFGVPPAVLPGTLDDFREYQRTVRLRLTADARAVARVVLSPPAPLALQPAIRALRPVTIGLLPPTIRELYGFRWSPAHGLALRAQARSVRTLLPATPWQLRGLEPERGTIPLRLLHAFAR